MVNILMEKLEKVYLDTFLFRGMSDSQHQHNKRSSDNFDLLIGLQCLFPEIGLFKWAPELSLIEHLKDIISRF